MAPRCSLLAQVLAHLWSSTFTPTTHCRHPAWQRPEGKLCKGKRTPSFLFAFCPCFCFPFPQHNPGNAASFRQWQFLSVAACDSKMHIQTQLPPVSCLLETPAPADHFASSQVQVPAPQNPSSEFIDTSVSSAAPPPGTPGFQLPESPLPSP